MLQNARLEVFVSMKIQVAVLWVVTPHHYALSQPRTPRLGTT